jgi:hypothetical protein
MQITQNIHADHPNIVADHPNTDVDHPNMSVDVKNMTADVRNMKTENVKIENVIGSATELLMHAVIPATFSSCGY